jgi:hypothetical protein
MNSPQTQKIESKMRDIQILHESLENQCPNIHKKRLKSLMNSVQSLLSNDALTLTLLGRSLPSKAKTEHCIKQVNDMGWCYLGHVRGDVNVLIKNQWQHIKQLFNKANSKPKYVGFTQLAKRKPLQCHLHL